MAQMNHFDWFFMMSSGLCSMNFPALSDTWSVAILGLSTEGVQLPSYVIKIKELSS